MNEQDWGLIPRADHGAAEHAESPGQYDRARLGYFSNKSLVFQILGSTTDTSVYTVPENISVPIRSMWVFNSDAGAVTFYFKILPYNVTAAAWLPKHQVSIGAGVTQEWTQLDDVLESRAQILAWGSVANKLLLKVNGTYVIAQ